MVTKITVIKISGQIQMSPSYIKVHLSNYSIIRVTLNTELDTLWFVKVDSPTEGLTKEYDTFPES